MYPGYEEYWLGVLENPTGVQPLAGQIPTESEVEYVRFADRTPHYVLSRTLDKVALRTARIVRDVAEIRTLKRLPGKHIHAVGGASLVSTLMNEGLVESASSRRAPIVLGQGKPLFENVEQRHALELIENTRLPGDRVSWLDRRRRSGARLQVH
jgi:dihydrofolate reductase